MDNFTGYINKSGKHIKDGLATRPTPFRVIDDNNVVLTWLVPEDGKFYERDFHYEIVRTGYGYNFNPPIDAMKVGIEAYECLRRYLEQKNI